MKSTCTLWSFGDSHFDYDEVKYQLVVQLGYKPCLREVQLMAAAMTSITVACNSNSLDNYVI